jgi:hypothetical protein
MQATLRNLTEIRSKAVESAEKYFGNLHRELSRNRLLALCGRTLDASLRISLTCETYDRGVDVRDIRERESLRESAITEAEMKKRAYAQHGGPQHRTPADSFASELRERGKVITEAEIKDRAYAQHGGSQQQVPAGSFASESLDDAVAISRRASVLAPPGSGKSVWSKQLASTAARHSLRQLSTRTDLHLAPVVWLELPKLAGIVADDENAQAFARRCGKISGELNSFQIALAKVLRAAHLEYGLDGWALRKTWQVWSETGQRLEAGLLCLDAWDEIASDDAKRKLMALIQSLERRLPAQLVITSRISAYEPGLLTIPEGEPAQRAARARELVVHPFRVEDAEYFLGTFLADRPQTAARLVSELRQKQMVAGMAQNPLMATLLGMMFGSAGGHAPPLPLQRAAVYEGVLMSLQEKEESVRKETPVTDPQIARLQMRFLAAIAFHFFPREALPAQEVEDLANELLTQECFESLRKHFGERQAPRKAGSALETCEPAPFLTLLLKGSVLTRVGSQDHYRFLHFTFQEYLVAAHLAEAVNKHGWKEARVLSWRRQPITVARLLSAHMKSAAWREVIILTLTQWQDPSAFLHLILRSAETDDSMLYLAAEILAEFSQDQRRPFQAAAKQLGQRIWRNWLITASVPAGALSCAASLCPAILSEATLMLEGKTMAGNEGRASRFARAANDWLGGSGFWFYKFLIPVEYRIARISFRGRERREALQRLGFQALREIGPVAATPEIVSLVANFVELPVPRKYPEDYGLAHMMAYEAHPAISALGPLALTPEIVERFGRLVHLWDNQEAVAAYGWGILERLRMVQRLRSAAATLEFMAGVAGHPVRLPSGFTPGDSVISRLEEFIVSTDAATVDAALWVVIALGPLIAGPAIMEPLKRMATDLDDVNGHMAATALGHLARYSPTPEVVSQIATALSSSLETVHVRGVNMTYAMGLTAARPEFIEHISRLLRDPAASRERKSSGLFLVYGFEEAAVVAAQPCFFDALLDLLRDAKEDNAWFYLPRVVEKMGLSAADEKFLEGLSQLLKDDFWLIRECACKVLQVMGRLAATPHVLKGLAPLLSENHERVRTAAYEAISAMGSAAGSDEVIEAFTARLVAEALMENETHRLSNAVICVGPKAATSALFKALRRRAFEGEGNMIFAWIILHLMSFWQGMRALGNWFEEHGNGAQN